MSKKEPGVIQASEDRLLKSIFKYLEGEKNIDEGMASILCYLAFYTGACFVANTAIVCLYQKPLFDAVEVIDELAKESKGLLEMMQKEAEK